MKRILIYLVTILLVLNSKAQYAEIDEKMEFLGIPFLSTPDYSQLIYFKPGPTFNLYTFKKEKKFGTANYTFSGIYPSVSKGRVESFLCTIKDDADYEKIKADLSASFSTQVKGDKATTYHGKNIIFALVNEGSSKNLYIATMQTDTLSNYKDNTGIVGLLGKKISDESVQKFIASIPGNSEKKVFPDETDITWEGNGIYISFRGTGEDKTLYAIHVYFVKDNYFWSKSPFKNNIELPYGINSKTTLVMLRDKFGKEDKVDHYYKRTFSDFHLETTFEDTEKADDKRKIYSITIQ